ncbi:hypothetical protein [Buchananella hordeovulneris]|uniref:hypothetical protein n=1 Tax=Buchananella hordeovulneris TaxID=52770 RepID=UPI0026DD812B|nr:hypothetical protein [Buchananella hordeovulneris]MDO5081525.1 hypothetical protein [Buchananella hordeovulneris]
MEDELMEAALAGDAVAMLRVALRYEQQEDEAQAQEWYARAARGPRRGDGDLRGLVA